MTIIGAGWLKQNKNNEHYISVNIDEAVQPLTLTLEKKIIIKPRKTKENDNQPDYNVELYIPKKKEEKDNSTDESVNSPF